MSEQYVYQFDFGLAPTAPSQVLRVFTALAESQSPAASDLAAFRLGAFLERRSMMNAFAFVGTPALVWETGIINNPDNPYHAALPAHGIRFSHVMGDDHYANGGFVLPYLVFDLVGEHGLFGIAHDATNRTSITLYFKEFGDLIMQHVEAPPMAYPLPPDLAGNPQPPLKGWKPAAAGDFRLGTFTRLDPAARERLIAEAG